MIWFFRASVVAYAGVMVSAAVFGPDRVPMHFGADGNVDRYQDKWPAVISLSAVGLGVAAVLWACIRFLPRGSMTLVNVPHKSWWLQEGHIERLRSMLVADLAWIGGCTMTLLSVMMLLTMRVADDADPDLGTAGWVAVLVYLAAVGGQVVYMFTSRYRPRED